MMTFHSSVTNEREGLPSASAMGRYSLCLGSYQAEKGIVGAKDVYSESGDVRHDALYREDSTGLSDEDKDVFEKALLMRDQFLSDFGMEKPDLIIKEQRLWLRDHHGNKIMSGKADHVAVKNSNGYAVILDYKTLWRKPTDAFLNMQLRALLVIVNANIGELTGNSVEELDHAVVGLISPNVSHEVDFCEYTRDDIITAENEVSRLLSAISKPNAPRTPGEEQCRFCKARGTARCPESVSYMSQIDIASDASIQTREQRLATYRLLKERVPLATAFCKALENEVKESPEAWPEFAIETKAGNREISDAQAAYDALEPTIGHEAFMECVSISVPALEKAFIKEFLTKNPEAKKKDAETQFWLATKDIVTRGEKTSAKLLENQ